MKRLFICIALLFTLMAVNAQTCGAKTQAGTECSRKVTQSGAKCWQHGGQTKAQASGAQAVTYSVCGATTKAGTPCKNKVKGGGKCHLHKD